MEIKSAVITAAFFAPTHVLIANKIEMMTNEQQFVSKHREQLCAYLNSDGEISYGHVQEIRKLRPYLIHLKEEANVGEAIVITSGKGGVGKTTTTANLGTALALTREKSMFSRY